VNQVVDLTQIPKATQQIDFVVAGMAKFQLVAAIDQLKQGLNSMIPIRAPAEHKQEQVEFSRRRQFQ
jgi:hypothetical protein